MENVARFDALSAFAICKEQRTLPRICRGGDAKKVTAIEGKSSAMEIDQSSPEIDQKQNAKGYYCRNDLTFCE